MAGKRLEYTLMTVYEQVSDFCIILMLPNGVYILAPLNVTCCHCVDRSGNELPAAADTGRCGGDPGSCCDPLSSPPHPLSHCPWLMEKQEERYKLNSQEKHAEIIYLQLY